MDDNDIELLFHIFLNKEYKLEILQKDIQNYDITNDIISIIQCYILTKFYEANSINYDNILIYKITLDNDNFKFENYNIEDILILFQKIKYFSTKKKLNKKKSNKKKSFKVIKRNFFIIKKKLK